MWSAILKKNIMLWKRVGGVVMENLAKSHEKRPHRGAGIHVDTWWEGVSTRWDRGRTPCRDHCVSEEPKLEKKIISANEWQMGQRGGGVRGAREGLELGAGARLGRLLLVKVRSLERGVGTQKSSPLRNFLSLSSTLAPLSFPTHCIYHITVHTCLWFWIPFSSESSTG